VKTYPSNQDCSDLSSYRLSDSVFVAVGNSRKEVGCLDRLSKEELKPFSFTELLRERCSPEKLITFLHGQLAGNDSKSKSTEDHSHAVKTYPSNQDCSDLSSCRLTDSASVAVGN